MKQVRVRWRKHLPRVVAMLALGAALWPAWRVVRLGATPTYAELLELRCLSPAIGRVGPAASSTGHAGRD